MCEPTTLLLIGTAVSTLGAGYSALQGNAQANYQAKVADQNARLSAEAAKQEQDNTRVALQQHWRQQAQLQGQQRVAMAAGGLDVNFGNAADLTADTQMLGREDAQRIIDQGANAVRGFDIESANYRSQAKASRQAATGALVGGAFDMASTALGGATQYTDMKARFGSTGRNAYGVKGAGNIY
ncbi:virion core protein, T7 gp14 family [Sphingobium indicum]